MSARHLLFATLLATLGAVACADFEGVVDPAGGLPDVEIANPSFTADIQPIFTRRCSIGGCHSFASRRGGLVLDAEHAYDMLVGVESAVNPALLRVAPGDPDASFLVHMIEANPTRRGELPRMPLGSQPLTERQIATIINWIAQGARGP